MSDEGRVTPADVTQDVMLHEVTPNVGKVALGAWRVLASLGHRAGQA